MMCFHDVIVMIIVAQGGWSVMMYYYCNDVLSRCINNDDCGAGEKVGSRACEVTLIREPRRRERVTGAALPAEPTTLPLARCASDAIPPSKNPLDMLLSVLI